MADYDFGGASAESLGSAFQNNATKLSNMKNSQKILKDQAVESKRIIEYYTSRQGKADMLKNLRKSLDKHGSKLYSNMAIRQVVNSIDAINSSKMSELSTKLIQGDKISRDQMSLFGNHINNINSFLGQINSSITVIEKGSSMIQRLANIIGDETASSGTKINAINRNRGRMSEMAGNDGSGMFGPSFQDFITDYRESSMKDLEYQDKIYKQLLSLGVLSAEANTEANSTLEQIQEDVGNVNENTETMTKDGFGKVVGTAFAQHAGDKFDKAGEALGDQSFTEMNDIVQSLFGSSIGGLAQKGISGIAGAGKGVLGKLFGGSTPEDEVNQYGQEREAGGIARSLGSIQDSSKKMLTQLIALVGITKMAAIFNRISMVMGSLMKLLGPALAVAGIGGLGFMLGKQIGDAVTGAISKALGKSEIGKTILRVADKSTTFVTKVFQKGLIRSVLEEIVGNVAENRQGLAQEIHRIRQNDPQFKRFKGISDLRTDDEFTGILHRFHPDAPETKVLDKLTKKYGKRTIEMFRQRSLEKSFESVELAGRKFQAFKEPPPPAIVNSGNKQSTYNYYTERFSQMVEAE